MSTALLLSIFWHLVPAKAYRLSTNDVTLSVVKKGSFQEFISLNAHVVPLNTQYLDITEGGRVEKIFVGNGDQIKAGAPIVELSNRTLELQVLLQESQLRERLNSLHHTQLLIHQSHLSLQDEVLTLEYDLARAQRQYKQHSPLRKKNLIGQEAWAAIEAELAFLQSRKKLLKDRQLQHDKIKQVQTQQFTESLDQLNRNLMIVRENLDNLMIRAPSDGQITGLELELGESVNPGQRIARVDAYNAFKVSVKVSEFYLEKVYVGQRAVAIVNDHEYEMSIAKIYPEVISREFSVDMIFVAAIKPENLRRGKALAVKLEISQEVSSLLLDLGRFYQDTGGYWAYVIDENSQLAMKRPVKLGRKNPQYIEVLSGINPGERVIISSYENYIDQNKIKIVD